MHIFRTVSALLCAAGMLCAVDTRTWQTGEMADFEKGTLTRLSVASDGRLALAPVVKEIFDPSVAFLWAVARDSKGNLYAGGGGLGGTKTKLFMVDPNGKSKTLAELEGIAIQAIAIDSKDRVYAATAPDGRFIASIPRPENPTFSTTPSKNTSGRWSFPAPAICSSLPAIRARSIG